MAATVAVLPMTGQMSDTGKIETAALTFLMVEETNSCGTITTIVFIMLEFVNSHLERHTHNEKQSTNK